MLGDLEVKQGLTLTNITFAFGLMCISQLTVLDCQSSSNTAAEDAEVNNCIMPTHWFLSILKCLLDRRDLTVSVFVDFFFSKLLFDGHANPKHNIRLNYTVPYQTTRLYLILGVETYLTSTFSLETPYLLNSVEIYSVFLIHGTTLACCWDLKKKKIMLEKTSH